MDPKAINSKHDGQSGMALMAVMSMLVIMTVIGTGMYKLVQTSIGVTSGFSRRATTRSVAVAHASLVFDSIVATVAQSTINQPPGLILNDLNILLDVTGALGHNNQLDSTELNPDFTYSFGGITSRIDVDFLQSVRATAGPLDFASAYDGVGNGQGLNGLMMENQVNVTAIDASGAKTNLRFLVTQ